jgi:hypothetical protein
MFIYSIIGFFFAFALNLIDRVIYFFVSFVSSNKKQGPPKMESVELDVEAKKGEGSLISN